MFGENLRKARETKGLSQQNMADYLHTTQSNYSKYEKNVIEPNNEMLIKISQILEIPIDNLLNENSITIVLNEQDLNNINNFYKTFNKISYQLNLNSANKSIIVNGSNNKIENNSIS